MFTRRTIKLPSTPQAVPETVGDDWKLEMKALRKQVNALRKNQYEFMQSVDRFLRGLNSPGALSVFPAGLWTPGVSFGGGTTGITYTGQAGSYTNAGDRILFNGFFTLSSKGSSTGAAKITGLPFTVANANSRYAAVALRLVAVSYTGRIQGYADANTKTIVLEDLTEAGSAAALDDTNFANTSSVMVMGMYVKA